MNLCSYLAYIQVNELLVFRTQCLEYSWNEKQDTSAINTPHSYSYTSSPSHNDEWPCQGEGRPGTKADCSGLLGGGSSSDKAKSLQEEMSCWLKAFMQVSHQDLSGRSVLNVLNSQIWRILWNQAKQFAFLYISYLTFISQNFNNSIATVKPESKEKNKTKKKNQWRKLIFLLIQWIGFYLNLEVHLWSFQHLSSHLTYLNYCSFVTRVILYQKWTETLGALMYREPHLKPKGNMLHKRYRRYLPKRMPIFSFHEAQVIFEPWTSQIKLLGEPQEGLQHGLYQHSSHAFNIAAEFM